MTNFIFQNANCEGSDYSYPNNILATVTKEDKYFFFNPSDKRLDSLRIEEEDLIILMECLQTYFIPKAIKFSDIKDFTKRLEELSKRLDLLPDDDTNEKRYPDNISMI